MVEAKKISTVTLVLDGEKASELMSILMYRVDWEDDEFGATADAIYNALDDADVSEA